MSLTNLGRAFGRALHRAVKKHRARLRIQREQAQHRKKAYRYLSCEKKQRYASAEFAAAVRDRVQREQGKTTHVYGPCRFCDGYHLTKQPPKGGAT